MLDITQIEYAALKFFEMCREHPEVCPHDYHWKQSLIDKPNNMEVKIYVCGLCGKEMQETKPYNN